MVTVAGVIRAQGHAEPSAIGPTGEAVHRVLQGVLRRGSARERNTLRPRRNVEERLYRSSGLSGSWFCKLWKVAGTAAWSSGFTSLGRRGGGRPVGLRKEQLSSAEWRG